MAFVLMIKGLVLTLLLALMIAAVTGSLRKRRFHQSVPCLMLPCMNASCPLVLFVSTGHRVWNVDYLEELM
jgi:hypothetical protein